MRRWLALTSVAGLLLVGCRGSEGGDQAEPADTTASTEPAATVQTPTSTDTTAVDTVDTTVSTEPAATDETATTPETTDDGEPLELPPPPAGAVVAEPFFSLVAAGAEDFGVDVVTQGERGWRESGDAGGWHIRDVVAGGPGFVAVGDVGGDAAVWTSPDGATWTRVTDMPDTVLGGEGTAHELGMVATGGPGLVAVTEARLGMGGTGPREIAGLVSTDGLSWTDVAEVSRDAIVTDVAAGGPGLVIAGHLPYADPTRGETTVALWTSPDGVTWTQVPRDEAVFGDMTSVAAVTAGGPGLVAVGADIGEPIDAAVWTSPDGLTWTRVPHDEAVFGDAWMSDVTVGGPGLVAVGTGDEGDAIWTSPDGVTWTRLSDEAFWFMRDRNPGGAASNWLWPSNELVTMGSHLVTVGDEIDMWISADGTTWSEAHGVGGGDGSVIAAAADDSTIVVIVSLGHTPAIWNVTFEFHDIDH